MSFNAVKETSAFEKKTSQNTKSNKIQAIEDKKIVKKTLNLYKIKNIRALPTLNILAKKIIYSH